MLRHTDLLPQLPHPVVVGMVHLHALAGAPRYGGSYAGIRDAALADAEALAAGGVDAIMIENFGDAPFYPGRVPTETVTQLTALAADVVRSVDVPVGVNVLRNDGESAIAVAFAAGAAFVRVNILTGARVADQGIIEGRAHEVLRLRARLGAPLGILADVSVKHSAPLAERPIEDELSDLVGRGGADGVVVSGARTGAPTDPAWLDRVRAATDAPVYVGSGVTLASATTLRGRADGFIVGTAFKVDGKVAAERVRAIAELLHEGASSITPR